MIGCDWGDTPFCITFVLLATLFSARTDAGEALLTLINLLVNTKWADQSLLIPRI